MIRDKVIPVLWLLLAAIIIGGSVGVEARADTNDDAFLTMLKQEGITYPSATLAVGLGHAICADLYAGTPVAAEIHQLWILTNLNEYDASYYAGAAVSAYCPGIAPAARSTAAMGGNGALA